jgi:hypothetical protein
MSDIYPGQSVVVRDAFGRILGRVAMTGVVRGLDFPVVWVSHEDEWRTAQEEGRDPDGVPFPADDVAESESCLA